MATALGIPLDRYRKYEVRSPLPQYLVERFALNVNSTVHYVMTGKAAAKPADGAVPFTETTSSRLRRLR